MDVSSSQQKFRRGESSAVQPGPPVMRVPGCTWKATMGEAEVAALTLLIARSPYSPSLPVWQPQKDPVPGRKCHVGIDPRITTAPEQDGLSSGPFIRKDAYKINFQR